MTIRWPTVQDVYSAEVQDHWTRSQGLGLDYPLDVFAFNEWAQSRRSTKGRVWTGVAALVIATIIIGIGNYLNAQR